MAYDEDLAGQVRQLLAGEPDLSEWRMFGGLAFLLAGSMAVAARGRGGLLVRVDPERADALTAAGEAQPLVMRGRPTRGWVAVEADVLRDPAELARWVALGVARARSLPGAD